MKLYQSPTSPYVRMVRAAAERLGLRDRIELANARADQEVFERINPLNKVPSLVTDDGESMIESRLICQYLDELAGPKLYPADPKARRAVLQREAVVHGVIDAAVLLGHELRREDSEKSAAWMKRQRRKIVVGMTKIEGELADFTDDSTIVPIELACTCQYMDRVYDEDWRKAYPGVAKWYEAYLRTPHMVATEIGG